MSTMKAALVEAQNTEFTIAEIEKPVARAGQILVRIKAAALNPLDLKIRANEAAHARHPLPAILGIDMAGIVEAVGPGVTGFRAGDEVYGMTGGVGGLQGSLAEFAAVDADLVALKPRNLSMREAAALPLIAITAWEGLEERTQVRAGHKVLVIGGGGGVGHITVQMAVAAGAEVYAVDGGSKAEYISSIGATPIDYGVATVDDYVARYTDGKGFDIVYDTIGGKGLDAAFQAVAKFGHVVTSLGWGTHSLAPLSFKGATYSGVFTLAPLLTGEDRAHHGDILRHIATRVEAGTLMPNLDPRPFSLAEVGEAYRLLESREAEGKVVVEI
ncbi:NADPH2:quinone reductase [Rhizobium sp. BK275]|uniref:zinc-dependent alcohol dehydrogenase family protein n=1 Tax=Rhizobium sp. BK275 TaxID=2587077 RepID=UPI001616E39F|nr:zinc-dependent alcohol dehydrogenase family protein [Rhizobium sp. BK275]MBB3389184.1 NADPH2:quinone reductase [Rhizobium sp. BK275]